jgi:hypothetical protein
MREMRKPILLCGFVFACCAFPVPGPAYAGPHAYGVILPHLNPNLEYSSSSSVSYAGQSDLRDCENAIAEGEILPEEVQIWFVMASFKDSPGPVDLAGIDFGFAGFSSSDIVFVDHGICDDGVFSVLELPTDGWPGPNEGTAVTFMPGKRSRLVEIYWFATYVYAAVSIEFDVDPLTDMGLFGDNQTPPEIDEIWDFGIMGFGESGYNPCEPNPGGGACCVAEECHVVSRDECEILGGRYKGDNTECFPNPCRGETIDTSWGRLKDLYR